MVTGFSDPPDVFTADAVDADLFESEDFSVLPVCRPCRLVTLTTVSCCPTSAYERLAAV